MQSPTAGLTPWPQARTHPMVKHLHRPKGSAKDLSKPRRLPNTQHGTVTGRSNTLGQRLCLQKTRCSADKQAPTA